MLCVKPISGAGLVAKDRGGTSDPYVKVGYGDADGKFLEKSVVKTETINKTVDPVWTQGKSFEMRNPAGNDKVLIQVWDADLMSDDFMGQIVTPLSDTKMSREPRRITAPVVSRAGGKDRVSGTITFELTYYTDDGLAKLKETLDLQSKLADGKPMGKFTEEERAKMVDAMLKHGSVLTDTTSLAKIVKEFGVWAKVEHLEIFGMKVFQVADSDRLFSEPRTRAFLDSNETYLNTVSHLLALLFGLNKNGGVDTRKVIAGLEMLSASADDRASPIYFGLAEDKGVTHARLVALAQAIADVQAATWEALIACGAGKTPLTGPRFQPTQFSAAMNADAAYCFRPFDTTNNPHLARTKASEPLDRSDFAFTLVAPHKFKEMAAEIQQHYAKHL